MEAITDITAVGLAGLAILLLYRLAAEHIRRNTEAFNRLTNAINRLEHYQIGHEHATSHTDSTQGR